MPPSRPFVSRRLEYHQGRLSVSDSNVHLRVRGGGCGVSKPEGTPSSAHASGQDTPAPPVSAPGAYLFAKATLKADHDMSVMMPPSENEFVALLKGGDQPCFTGADEPGLTCTGAQLALLPALIEAFNAAASAQERFELLNRYMVDAATVEKAAGAQTVGELSCRVARYDLVAGSSPTTVYFLEDYPDGTLAHGKTLAVGVMRWARFHVKLVDLQVHSFANADERDAAQKADSTHEDA